MGSGVGARRAWVRQRGTTNPGAFPIVSLSLLQTSLLSSQKGPQGTTGCQRPQIISSQGLPSALLEHSCPNFPSPPPHPHPHPALKGLECFHSCFPSGKEDCEPLSCRYTCSKSKQYVRSLGGSRTVCEDRGAPRLGPL